MKPASILAAAILASGLTAAALEPGAPFADNAILQREMPVPVWGWGKPGAGITVEFAGQKKSATAADDGKWTLTLDALEASADPRAMTITEKGGGAVTLENLLVGEVWMASGQSNMQWVASKSSVANLINQLKENGETPPIREFQVASVTSALHPIERATGQWKTDDFGNHSAVAFAFALMLHEELGVPIGILNCSFSETSIEAWTPRVGFADGTDDYTRSLYQKILVTDPSTPEHKAAWGEFYQSLEDTITTNAALVADGKPAQGIPVVLPGNLRGNRDATWMFNGRVNPVVPFAIRGAIWNQGYANINGGLRYYHNLHSLIRGWRIVWDQPELPVYFHQFYCPGSPGDGDAGPHPSIAAMAEMRLGTWLARDIPHTGMASQIDIAGSIHYLQKALPAQRLALHALKNQYGKNVVADGPMFKSYTVRDNQLVVEFDHADGGLIVAETFTNSGVRPSETCDGLATPVIVPDGASKVDHFWLAGEDLVWHPATIRIDGKKVIVTSPAVKEPRGVSYGTGGIGFRHGLYNKALLPATPFIYYDNEIVTSETWPDSPLQIVGVVEDPSQVGLPWKYRRLPLLSTQFRDNAVFQADMPVTIFGGTLPYPRYVEEGEAVIHFKFGDIEKTIPVPIGMEEWSITLPPRAATTEPHTLRVSFHVDGEMVHERVAQNIIFGDVWYVASPPLPRDAKFDVKKSGPPVRVIARVAKRSSSNAPSRFSIATSSADPRENRFASFWHDAEDDLASAIGHRIAAKTGRPTGIVFMDSADVPLSHWMAFDHLKNAPSLSADYQDIAQVRPGNEFYDANVRRYISTWQTHWNDYIPQMIATRAVPDGVPWGVIPSFASAVSTKATQTHNVLAASFVPGSFKGIIFLTGPAMVEGDQAATFGPELTALANGYAADFGGSAKFIHTMPEKSLAAKVTSPSIPNATAIPIKQWDDFSAILDGIESGL